MITFSHSPVITRQAWQGSKGVICKAKHSYFAISIWIGTFKYISHGSVLIYVADVHHLSAHTHAHLKYVLKIRPLINII